jgi:hypothetical protein
MVANQIFVVCNESGAFWSEGGEPAACTDVTHEHQRIEVHRHRDLVTLPDGTEVVAVSFDAADPYGRDRRPDAALYLDARWQPPWPHDHLDWPDFGVPADQAQVVTALRALLDRARAGAHVEVGCLGGHGRTGTALACLAVLSGLAPGEAVAWVRAAYCSGAVETPEQEAFVAALDR